MRDRHVDYRSLRRRSRVRRLAWGLVVLALVAALGVTGIQAIARMRADGGPAATRPEGRPSTTPSRPSPVPSPSKEGPALPRRTLRPGDRGPGVLALQRMLEGLGYPVPSPDGSFGPVTEHAVMAFQKVHRLAADGVVGAETRRALLDPVTIAPRGSGPGPRVEVDLVRQVMWLVEDGDVTEIYDVSTGNGEIYWQDGREQVAVTPPGSFEVTWRVDGWRDGPLGLMYRPVYFNGGIAIHGSPDVPAHPASHGCVRVTNWVIDGLFERLQTGMPVLVF